MAIPVDYLPLTVLTNGLVVAEALLEAVPIEVFPTTGKDCVTNHSELSNYF